MTFAELKENKIYTMADTVLFINQNRERIDIEKIDSDDLLEAHVVDVHFHESDLGVVLQVMLGLDYSLVFKMQNGVKLYISGFNEDGSVLHHADEKEAFKFYNICDAMKYYDLGCGIDTRVIGRK